MLAAVATALSCGAADDTPPDDKDAAPVANEVGGGALAGGAAASGAADANPSGAPSALLGEFRDDYGNSYEISPSLWVQLPHGRFHITEWYPEQRYLIAVNDSANSHAPGKWTRIDWAELRDMPPYEWAYCLSEYQAASREEAERSAVAVRDSLRTGCNGYPFSRMAPAAGADSLL